MNKIITQTHYGEMKNMLKSARLTTTSLSRRLNRGAAVSQPGGKADADKINKIYASLTECEKILENLVDDDMEYMEV